MTNHSNEPDESNSDIEQSAPNASGGPAEGGRNTGGHCTPPRGAQPHDPVKGEAAARQPNGLGDASGAAQTAETPGVTETGEAPGAAETAKAPEAIGGSESSRSTPLPEPFEPPSASHRVTLRSRTELADSLPYLLGYQPENSIVLMAVHGDRGRIGRRVRMGIPAAPEDWPAAAEQIASCVLDPFRDMIRPAPKDESDGVEEPGRPDRLVVFLCQDPEQSSTEGATGGDGAAGRAVMERLRPLAQALRLACGRLDVPVFEALCIAGGRHWSYVCPEPGCCPPEGEPLPPPGTSVLAAASVYSGQREPQRVSGIERRLMPWRTAAALDQEYALDVAAHAFLPRLVGSPAQRGKAMGETLGLVDLLIARLAAAAPQSPQPSRTGKPSDLPTQAGALLDPTELDADQRDDELLSHDEAATVLLGLQDRTTRDHAAAWMEGPTAPAARRLWRALARRCVGPYAEYAAAPLALDGWVSWSLGDVAEARLAFHLALAADQRYVFAALLDEACDRGIEVEAIRQYLRRTCRGHAHTGKTPAHAAGAGVDHRASVTGRGAARDRAQARRVRNARSASGAATGTTRPPGSPSATRSRSARGPAGSVAPSRATRRTRPVTGRRPTSHGLSDSTGSVDHSECAVPPGAEAEKETTRPATTPVSEEVTPVESMPGCSREAAAEVEAQPEHVGVEAAAEEKHLSDAPSPQEDASGPGARPTTTGGARPVRRRPATTRPGSGPVSGRPASARPRTAASPGIRRAKDPHGGATHGAEQNRRRH